MHNTNQRLANPSTIIKSTNRLRVLDQSFPGINVLVLGHTSAHMPHTPLHASCLLLLTGPYTALELHATLLATTQLLLMGPYKTLEQLMVSS
jgi:hypothetical protein